MPKRDQGRPRAEPKPREPHVERRLTDRLNRRIWPIVISIAYVCVALCYFFLWGPVVRHIPAEWVLPYDPTLTYLAAIELAHGHLSAIYSSHVSEMPGIIITMAPLGALSNVFHTTLLAVNGQHTSVLTHYSVGYPGDWPHNIKPLLGPGVFKSGGKLLVARPQWAVAVETVALVLSCVAFFSFDALAERLGVSKARRAFLSVVEAVLLWNVIVNWGHPEDVIALSFGMYALTLALDRRFVGAGWLCGAAVLFQPLVVLILPVLFTMAGPRRWLGFALRTVVPSAVLLSVPLIANFSAVYDDVIKQADYTQGDHTTPFTSLSPHLSGQGANYAVEGGPGRLLCVLLAVLIGVWAAKRWRERPEYLVFACAIALALRSYTESALAAYYPWSALAVAMIVAARCNGWRFATAASLAICTSVASQWNLPWIAYWTIQIVGITALLVVTAKPERAPVLAKVPLEPGRVRWSRHATGHVKNLNKGSAGR